jgi:hypothetical protein
MGRKIDDLYRQGLDMHGRAFDTLRRSQCTHGADRFVHFLFDCSYSLEFLHALSYTDH